MTNKFEKHIQILEDSGNYRVIKRLEKTDRYNADDESRKFTGIYLDVETTGMDPDEDDIIEIAMVSFEFSSEGKIYRILDEYNEMNDPGYAIPAEITRITGITDDMVKGKSIDIKKLNALIQSCDLVIAHNANFDRPFVENLTAEFEKKPWGCSMADVPWQEEGLESVKLEYLAYRYRYFYEGHRATIDCLAGIHLLSQQLPSSKELALKFLLISTRESQYRIWAANAAFDKKDILKERKYRWNSGDNGEPKAWWKDINEADKGAELEFLTNSIYGKKVPQLPEVKITAFNRYSKRINLNG